MRHPFHKLIAALCLWMGTGGVLHHSDNLAYVASLAAPVGYGHVTPALPADDCAACEWTQGLQTGPPISYQVALPLDAVPSLVNTALVIWPTSYPFSRSPRGPPNFLS
jgi:hypothetical protein